MITHWDVNLVEYKLRFSFSHRIVDNLPCVTKLGSDDGTGQQQFEVGYRLGFMSPDQERAYLNNHLDFTILYHTEDEYVNKNRMRRALINVHS